MSQPLPAILSGRLHDLTTGADGTRTFTLETVVAAKPLTVQYSGAADLDGWLSRQQEPAPPVVVFAAQFAETPPIIAQSVHALTWQDGHWRIDSLPTIQA